MEFPDSHLPLILTAPHPTYYVAVRLKGGRVRQQQRQQQSSSGRWMQFSSSSSRAPAAGDDRHTKGNQQAAAGQPQHPRLLPLLLQAMCPPHRCPLTILCCNPLLLLHNPVLRCPGGAGRQMLARVRVNGVSFHPEGYSHPLCSDTEVWRYEGWRHWSHVPGQPK